MKGLTVKQCTFIETGSSIPFLLNDNEVISRVDTVKKVKEVLITATNLSTANTSESVGSPIAQTRKERLFPADRDDPAIDSRLQGAQGNAVIAAIPSTITYKTDTFSLVRVLTDFNRTWCAREIGTRGSCRVFGGVPPPYIA
ncbi:hypothetical protein FVEN_g12624 [Fusarium venenatum]|nr:hypothetical protein FVEN_g12624 [Fusarium venenatum]